MNELGKDEFENETLILPSLEKDVKPESHTYKGIVKIFVSLQKVDKMIKLYPIYKAEAGETAMPPIVDVALFPSDIEALQMNYTSLDNPWDLKKVLPGETDLKTGEEKKQKVVYITVLLMVPGMLSCMSSRFATLLWLPAAITSSSRMSMPCRPSRFSG
jgi:hypothetical protein